MERTQTPARTAPRPVVAEPTPSLPAIDNSAVAAQQSAATLAPDNTWLGDAEGASPLGEAASWAGEQVRSEGTKAGIEHWKGKKGIDIKGSLDIESGRSIEYDEDGVTLVDATGGQISAGGAKGAVAASGSYENRRNVRLRMGRRKDGSMPTPDEVLRQQEVFEADLADGKGDGISADDFFAGLDAMQAGDSYARDRVKGVSGSVGGGEGVQVSVGGSQRHEVRETYAVEDGKVVVTLGDTETKGASAGVAAGPGGIVGAEGSKSKSTEQDLKMEFDIHSEDEAVAAKAKRDLALYRFGGLLPGAADALGIETYEDAVAWLEAKDENLDALGVSVDKLNEDAVAAAKARQQAEIDGEVEKAAYDPYKHIGTGEKSEADAGVTGAGVSLWGKHWEQEHGVVYEDGERKDSGSSTEEKRRIFGDDTRKGSRVVATDDGDVHGIYYTSEGDAAEKADGPLADALKKGAPGAEAAADAVDDPTLVVTMDGSLEKLGEAYAKQGRKPSDSEEYIAFEGRKHLHMYEQELVAEAMKRGEDPAEFMKKLNDDWAAIARMEGGDGTVEDLTPEQLELYKKGLEAMAKRGDEDTDYAFELVALEAMEDPAKASEAIAKMVAEGDADTLARFQEWLEESGMSDVLHVDAGLVAGSTHLKELGKALDAGQGEVAEHEAAALLEKLVGAGMSPEALEETLQGFDLTGAVAGKESGGLRRFYEALPPGDRATFMKLVGGTPAGKALLEQIQAERPDLLIDPSIPPEEQEAWLQENLGSVLGGEDGLDAEALRKRAEEAREAYLAMGDAKAFGVAADARYRDLQRDDPDYLDKVGDAVTGLGSTYTDVVGEMTGSDTMMAGLTSNVVGEGGTPEEIRDAWEVWHAVMAQHPGSRWDFYIDEYEAELERRKAARAAG
ncbi:MAG: hypothetical protein H6737_14725 [Alphaproteobacteria bacterium]|nr:hypothetical protein [Alphaproteobacteria bacterium]